MKSLLSASKNLNPSLVHSSLREAKSLAQELKRRQNLQSIERDKEECRDLSTFIQSAWPEIDPQPYVHGWHMDALSEHLQATAQGDIKRLLINIPPGTSKSTATSVFFPAWLWGPYGWPEARFIGASYEQSLATRDNRKNRLLIESEWYQERWPTKLISDQNEKTSFENTKQGWRQSCAVKSMTGKRGDFVVWDDPLSPEKAYSEAERDTANRVFAETLPTRLNDPVNSVIIIIMQRLHEEDVSGYILARDLGYEHLCLPMEYEAERACKTSIGFSDPRSNDGELLFEERFPKEVVDRDKAVMGGFAVAGQFQQRPAPREGGLFKRGWFKFVDEVPQGVEFIRGWDLAATEATQGKDPAYTAGVLVGRYPDGRFVIADSTRIQGTPNQVEQLLINTASQDGRNVKGSIPQDPGQAGKSQAQYLIRQLAGYTYEASPESGDKVRRAEPLAAQCEAGNVDILRGSWNQDFMEEICMFPASKFKDQVDAASRAFNILATQEKRSFSVSRF